MDLCSKKIFKYVLQLNQQKRRNGERERERGREKEGERKRESIKGN